MAWNYDKIVGGVHDHTIILAAREFWVGGFQTSPPWTDLRVGFFLSVTAAGPGGTPLDDNINSGGIEETIGTEPRPFLDSTDRYQIGLLDRVTGQVFCGFTNRGISGRELTAGSTKLVPSDKGVGTSNTNYWRPKNEIDDARTFQMIDNHVTRAYSRPDSAIHFARAGIGGAGPAGYATLLMLRFQRDDARGRAKIISMSCKRDTVNHNGDVLFTNTPTAELLDSNLNAFPTSVQQIGPVELSQEPDTLFLYWPFRGSRLRCHARGILRAA